MKVKTASSPVKGRVAGREAVALSACLLGVKCRYDGEARYVPQLTAFLGDRQALPLCPEHLGGFPTPRPPVQFWGGDGRALLAGQARLKTSSGLDVSREMVEGAKRACRIIRQHRVSLAVLKEGSPSCGRGRVTVEGESRKGVGLLAELLIKSGITVLTEEELRN